MHHWALDWRLGLDMVDLVMGDDLQLSRWDARTKSLLSSFADAYGTHLDLEHDVVGGLPALLSREGGGRAVVIGHPIWQHGEEHWTVQMRRAVTDLRDRGLANVAVSDTYVLDRRPIEIFKLLIG